MFDIGASELLLTVIVAIVVIGPKDLPRALRMAGGWLAKFRRVSGHFRSGIDEMIRQAELEEMEKKWKEKNEAIMQEAAATADTPAPASAEAALPDYSAAEVQPADHAADHSGDHPADHPGDPHPLAAPPPAAPPLAAKPAPEPVTPVASPELPLAPPAAKP